MLTLAPTNPDFKIKGVQRRKPESVSPYPLFQTARIHKSSFLLKRKRCTIPLQLLQAIILQLDPLEACASAEKSRPMLSTAVAICFWWSCYGITKGAEGLGSLPGLDAYFVVLAFIYGGERSRIHRRIPGPGSKVPHTCARTRTHTHQLLHWILSQH